MEGEGFGHYMSLNIWGRGCDLKIFRPDRRSESFRASKGIAPDDVVVLWVGRMVPEKRPDIWLNVMKRLQEEGVNVKPMLVGQGSGPLSSGISKDIQGLICCGWLSGIALAEAYASADILLFPSGVETFGNVTLESLASGCPSIVEAKCSGHLVEHGKNGYCCPDGDFEAYYRATKSLAMDAELRKRMREYARESSWRFERNKIMHQMAENYKDAIVKHRDPTYIKRHLQQSPEASGKNYLAFFCCQYWLVKTIAEPFLKTSVGIQNVYVGAQDCVSTSRTRLSCHSLAAMDYSSLENRPSASSPHATHTPNAAEEEKRERMAQMVSLSLTACFSKGLHYVTIFMSYGIVLLFVYASFTV